MKPMTISEAASAAGVGIETVRFCERRHLIVRPPKPAGGGFRRYPSETIERIRFIRQAQGLGFSLREIEDLLSLRADPATGCGQVRERATAKLEHVERKIAELGLLRLLQCARVARSAPAAARCGRRRLISLEAVFALTFAAAAVQLALLRKLRTAHEALEDAGRV